VLHAEWAGARFELRVAASAADMWLRGRFTGDDWPRLPPPIRAAAFEAALRDALCALDSVGRGAVRLESLDESAPAPAPRDGGHHFALTLAREGSSVSVTVSTDTFGLMLLAGLAAQGPAMPGPLARANVRVPLRAEIGVTTLSNEQLRGLAPGDALLLDDCWIGPDRELWLRHAGWGVKVRAEGAHLEVTEPFCSLEGMMDDDYDDPDIDDDFADGEPAEIDALPVRLHFDIGHRTIPLGELCQLQVGQVLELARPLSQAVNIRANGALVGTGELLEIGGRIAVSITSLGRPRAAGE
jgi:type III secretion protein Q